MKSITTDQVISFGFFIDRSVPSCTKCVLYNKCVSNASDMHIFAVACDSAAFSGNGDIKGLMNLAKITEVHT